MNLISKHTNLNKNICEIIGLYYEVNYRVKKEIMLYHLTKFFYCSNMRSLGSGYSINTLFYTFNCYRCHNPIKYNENLYGTRYTTYCKECNDKYINLHLPQKFYRERIRGYLQIGNREFTKMNFSKCLNDLIPE